MIPALVQQLGSANNKTAGTTLAHTFAATTSPGNLIVARVLFDNAGTASKPIVSSITKQAGETATWQFLGAARSTSTSAGAFASGEMWAIKTTVAWSGSFTVTLDTSVTQKAIAFTEFSGAQDVQRSTVGTNYSTTTTAASATTTGTTPAVNDLALGFIFGSNVAAAQAGDTDTTGGSWSTPVGFGSTGGSGATNNFGIEQYKVLTAGSHQTLNNSATMTAGNGAIVAILQSIPEPTLTQAAYRLYADGLESGQSLVHSYSLGSGVENWYDSVSSSGQSFQGTGRPLVRVTFDLARTGSPSGSLSAHIYAHTGSYGSGGVPTGSPLATSTNTVSASSLSVVPSYTTTGFLFDGSFTPVNGTPYFVIVKTDTVGTSTDFVALERSITAPLPAGNHAQYLIGISSWNARTDVAEHFAVYSDSALAAQDAAPTVDVSSGDANVQVRVRMQSTTSADVQLGDDFQLQWEKNASGTWTSIGSDVLADSHSAGGLGRFSLNSSSGASTYVQSFTGNGKKLKRARFQLSCSAQPVNAVTGYLYDHTGTYGTSSKPAGTLLATSTNTVAGTSIPVQGSDAWFDFNFDGTYTIVNGTRYCIGVGCTPVANGVLVSQSGSGTHGGNTAYFAASTWTQGSQDLWFEVYVAGDTVFPYDSANLTDAAPTTNRLTGGTGTFQAGKVSEDGLVDDLGWTGNNYTELLYSITLKQADLTYGDSLRFRVLRNGATTGITYSKYPTINLSPAAIPVTPSADNTGLTDIFETQLIKVKDFTNIASFLRDGGGNNVLDIESSFETDTNVDGIADGWRIGVGSELSTNIQAPDVTALVPAIPGGHGAFSQSITRTGGAKTASLVLDSRVRCGPSTSDTSVRIAVRVRNPGASAVTLALGNFQYSSSDTYAGYSHSNRIIPANTTTTEDTYMTYISSHYTRVSIGINSTSTGTLEIDSVRLIDGPGATVPSYDYVNPSQRLYLTGPLYPRDVLDITDSFDVKKEYVDRVFRGDERLVLPLSALTTVFDHEPRWDQWWTDGTWNASTEAIALSVNGSQSLTNWAADVDLAVLGSRIFSCVSFTQAAAGSWGAEFDLDFGIEIGDVFIAIDSGELWFGVWDTSLGPYDPVNHAYLAFRCESDAIYFETSADGCTWVERGSITPSNWVGFPQPAIYPYWDIWSNGGSPTAVMHIHSFNGVILDFSDSVGLADTSSVGIVGAVTLLAEYGFTEGSGTSIADTSGNNRTATKTGGTWVPGHANTAIQAPAGFQTDVVTVPRAGLETPQRTMMCWAKVSDTTIQYAVRFRNSDDSGVWGILPVGTAGSTKATFRIKIGGNNYDLHPDNPTGASWTHYAMTYDATTFKVYLNGSLVGSAPVTGTIDAASGFFDMVCENLITVDDVRLYDQALELADIVALMNTPVGPLGVSLTLDQSDSTGLTDRGAITDLDKRDAIGTTDSVWWDPSKSDAVGITDAGREFGKFFSDSAILTDVGTSLVSQESSDAVGVTDVTTSLVQPSQSDRAGVTDASVQLDRSPSFSDTTGLVDISANSVAKELADTAFAPLDTAQTARDVNFSDSVVTTDTVQAVSSLGTNLADTESITDASVQFTHSPSFSDSVAITDVATKLASLASSDLAGVSDSIAMAAVFGRDFVDGAGITDSIAVVKSVVINVSDSTNLIDISTKSIARDLTDQASVTDAVSTVESFLRDFPELAGLADTVVTAKSAPGDYADLQNLTDSFSLLASYVRSSIDSTGLVDSFSTNLVSAGVTGRPKVWNGSVHVSVPSKRWNGTVWVEQPWKQWTGSAWQPVS